MSLPITYLQSILHNDENELDKYRFFSEQLRTGEYLVELKTGELVTINQLTRFYETYSKGYKFVPEEKAKAITKDLDELITKYKEKEKVERKPKEESQVSSEQEVEVVCAPTVGKTKRSRRSNKNKTEKV